MTTVQIGEIQLGYSTFQASEIFAAQPPTGEEMANFCRTFGQAVRTGTSVLKDLKRTEETTEHPWLLAIIAGAHGKIQQGETIVGGMAGTLRELYIHRISELNAKKPPKDWRNFSADHWSMPDFFGYFADFFSLVNVGEESGDLDNVLSEHLVEVYLGQNGYGKKTWGHDISIMCRAVAVLVEAGVSNREIARVLGDLPSLISLRPNLKIVKEQVESGETLSNAFRKSGGRLSNPTFCEFIKTGEQAGLDLHFKSTRVE